MKTLLWYAKLAKIFFRMNAKNSANYYGWSFIAIYVAHVLGYIASYITIWGSMRSFNGVMGWSMQEVMFLYSMDLLAYSLANMFVQPFWHMDVLINKGKLDDYLLRPVHSLVHIIFSAIQFGYLAHISVALVAMIAALLSSSLVWTFGKFVMFVIAITGGTLIHASLRTMPSCASFWIIESGRFSDLFGFDVRKFIEYPIVIFPMGVQFVISFIVPVAFTNYYPSLVLLDRAQGVWVYGPLFTLIIGFVLAALTVLLWNFSVKKYSSAG